MSKSSQKVCFQCEWFGKSFGNDKYDHNFATSDKMHKPAGFARGRLWSVISKIWNECLYLICKKDVLLG